MKIVSTSYSKTAEYNCPQEWLKRVSFYTGILEELAKEHEVCSIERINYEGSFRQNGVHYVFTDLKKKVERFPWKMHRFIKQLEPDVVFVNGFIFPLQIIQLRWTVGKKTRIIVLHRAEKPFSGWKKWLQILADKYVFAYMFTSKEFGHEWTKNGNIGNGHKIYEVMQASSSFRPIDKKEARKKSGVEGSSVYLWVGRLEKNKDPLTVVNAFTRFQSLHPSARLYMIFQTEELFEEVKKIVGDSKAVIMVGKKEHSELQCLYSSADFILSGSHYEGGGTAISEAMSCGCVPIVTNIVSFRKMVGGCGILYEPGNIESLVRALESSLKMDIAEQRKKVLGNFERELSFRAIAQKIEPIIAKRLN